MTRPLAEVCREAEECLKNWDDPRHDFAAPGYVALRHSDAVDCVLALRALLALLAAEPEGKACGSISAVRSDATPAQPSPSTAHAGRRLDSH